MEKNRSCDQQEPRHKVLCSYFEAHTYICFCKCPSHDQLFCVGGHIWIGILKLLNHQRHVTQKEGLYLLNCTLIQQVIDLASISLLERIIKRQTKFCLIVYCLMLTQKK